MIQTENSRISFDVTTSTPDETEAAGEKIASFLFKGSVLSLSGPLGAGKTCLVKGIARFFGIEAEITSPTYTIISEYEAFLGSQTKEKIPFYHIDAYRLMGDDDFSAMGGEEYLEGGGISVVEWSERIKNSLPRHTFHAEIKILDGQRRHISFEGAFSAVNLRDGAA